MYELYISSLDATVERQGPIRTRDSMSLGGLSILVKAGTFRTALKAVEKNSKTWVHKYISQKIRMQYELYEGLHESKGTKAAA